MWSQETLQNIIDWNKAIAWDAAMKHKRNDDSILLVSDGEKSDQSSMSEWKPLRVPNGPIYYEYITVFYYYYSKNVA